VSFRGGVGLVWLTGWLQASLASLDNVWAVQCTFQQGKAVCSVGVVVHRTAHVCALWVRLRWQPLMDERQMQLRWTLVCGVQGIVA
jgi:hypothetical protein